MNLFGVGVFEALLVAIIGLIIVGPNKFPEMMKQAGRWFRIARAFSSEVMKDVREAVDEIQEEVEFQEKELGELREITTELEKDLSTEGQSVQTAVGTAADFSDIIQSNPPATESDLSEKPQELNFISDKKPQSDS